MRNLRPGGIPPLLSALCRHLMDRGHAPCIYDLGLASEVVAEVLDGIPIESGGRPDGSGYRGHADAFLKWQSWVDRFRPHVIQSHVGLVDVYAAATRAPKGCVKVRAALAPQLFPAQPWFGYFFENLAAPWVFDHHVAVSPGVARNLIASGVAPSDVTTILNPITHALFAKAHSRDFAATSVLAPLNAPGLGVRLAYLGRLSDEKGPDRAIRWFATMVRAHGLGLSSRLFLGGEGGIRPSLEALSHELGVASQVVFLGHVRDPSHFLPYVHCVLSPSRYEGLPIALIEAGAMGCAIAATRTDGARVIEALAREFFSIPNSDELPPETLASFARWLESRKLGRDSNMNLKDAAVPLVNPDRVAGEYLALYQGLLA